MSMASFLSAQMKKDSIFIKTLPSGTQFFEHQIIEKETIYSLKKRYNTTLEAIYALNPETKNTPLSLGQPVKIPVKPQDILYQYPKNPDSVTYVPIYHLLKKGETLYSVKTTYRTTIDQIKSLNKIENNQVNLGAALMIGWIKLGIKLHPTENNYIDNEVKSFQVLTIKEPENIQLQKQFFLQDTANIAMQNGPAVCNLGKGKNILYAFHNESAPGSILKIYHPMSGRVIYLKNLGSIPQLGFKSYDRIVISEKAAQLLKLQDSRVNVTISYIRPKE